MPELERIGNEQSLIIAVGYMLRYNSAIEAAKALLEEVRPITSYNDSTYGTPLTLPTIDPLDTRRQSLTSSMLPCMLLSLPYGPGGRAVIEAHRVLLQIGRKPVSFVGRYNCTYNNIAKPAWWDTLKSGGCIVEQATHFVDAMRYLSKSEFKRDSIQAVGVGPDMELSDMPAPPNAEHTVRSPSPALPHLRTHGAHTSFKNAHVMFLLDRHTRGDCMQTQTQQAQQ